MFIGQLFKILFFAAFIYMFYNLIRYLIRAGKVLHDKRSEGEKTSQQNIREERMSARSRQDTIELDKDQYKVE
jgi:hypothetical protein